MFINPKITDELYNDAGLARCVRAKNYVKEKKVSIQKIYYEDMNNFSIDALVNGNFDDYNVYISVRLGEIDNVTCECEDYLSHYGTCKHAIAVIQELDGNPKYTNTLSKNSHEKYTEFKELINTFYTDDVSFDTDLVKNNVSLYRDVKVVPKIIYDRFTKELKIDFKIGITQLYKLKDLPEFYDNVIQNRVHKYGAKLEFLHERDAFSDESKPILDFILKHAEIIKYVNNNANNGYRYYGRLLNTGSITLTASSLDEIFEIFKNKHVMFEKDYNIHDIEFVEQNPDLEFELEKIDSNEYKLNCKVENHNSYEIFEGKKATYFLKQDKLYKCDEKYKASSLKLLQVFRSNFTKEIRFNKEQMPNFFSIVLPKVKKDINLNAINSEEIEKYIPQKLGVKVFLEFNEKNYIIAKIKFVYGDEEFDPIKEHPHIARNVIEETESLNILRKTGFMIDKKNSNFVLADDNKIYDFLSNDINLYMQKFEVLATEDFKQKQIKHPKIGTLGVKIENNLLSINLDEFNFDKSELKDILQKYSLKKKYHRLKDGTFLSLEENEDIDFVENLMKGADLDYKKIAQDTIQLPVYRTLYLDRILNKIENTQIKKDENYKQLVNSIDDKSNIENLKIPTELKSTLRLYQKTGYKWLKTIDEYQFGGILADDMGLGKTLQIIAIILEYKKEHGNKPILVVCPSSLVLNWKNEIKRFAPKIQAQVISGIASEREYLINSIPENDVVITSYDLLKRDIDIYKNMNYEFRYIIADEAQYIKNSNTQNAKAIKQINAKTRFALTGTPIENSLSELWSIFDFLMPGYLFSYHKFKEVFESPIIKDNDEQAMKKLKMLIEPFILRRTKKQVLTELPDKTITILNNEMEEEQQKIYMSYLAQARSELQEELQTNGFENSHIKILALLTRLRQICCHPSLFINNYTGQASKLKQCIEIIQDAISSGHKILLFSGYTSMFDIIEKELKKEKIQYYKLTGQTKVSTRIDLVDDFNNNPDVKVFLISLKAGGTGLNLTGADMVIHYDPWWNLSAENQATDRAYRIGQKNNVQVYKLITKNSIEEKIYDLQEKKAKLIDNVLDTKTSFINKLSKEDIIKLFE